MRSNEGRTPPLQFVHRTLAQTVRFGSGDVVASVRAEVEERGASSVMLIASERALTQVPSLAETIAPRVTWTTVVEHVPIEVAEAARRAASDADVDLLVCLGGGSAVGLAKAIALTSGVPIVAVPTTFAGSESTNVWGLTENDRKTTGIDDRVLPSAVVYDAQLVCEMPPRMAIASGLNGMAHCIDGFWAPRADPINAAIGAEALRALIRGLSAIDRDREDCSGWEHAQYGAYLAGVAFASAGSGLHHKICHALGGTYRLQHAGVHAVMMPYVTALNIDAAPEAEARIAGALRDDAGAAVGDTFEALAAVYQQLDAPRSLADLGFRRADITEAVDIVLPTVPDANPRPVTRADLAAMLDAAWRGAPAGLLRR